MKLKVLLFGLFAVVLAGAAAPSTARAEAPDTPPTFRGGAGTSVQGPVDLHGGLLVLRARHSGAGNFTVWLTRPKDGVPPDQDWVSNDLMINTIGQYNGASAVGVRQDGGYVLQVTADGPFQLWLDQPAAGSPDGAQKRDFAGTGQQVTPLFSLAAGTIAVSLTHAGSTPRTPQTFNVALYDTFGGAVGGDYADRFLTATGPYSGTVTLNVPADGWYLFAVDADGSSTDGKWTIHVDGAPAAAAAAQAPDTPPTFHAEAGRSVLGPVSLYGALVVLRARHSGAGNFTVWLTLPKDGVPPDQDWEWTSLMINTIGQYNGASAAGTPRDGGYVLQVTADGPVDLWIDQPWQGADATAGRRDFSGRGQQVTPLFHLTAGRVTVSMTHSESTAKTPQTFNVALYDVFGGAVAGDYAGRFLTANGPYHGSVTLDVPADGWYLFAVDADGSFTDGKWTIHVDGP